MKALISALFVAAAVGAALPAGAAGDHGSAAMPMAAAAGMSDGVVKKVDPAAGKITIKHGPLQNLGMPGMTMVFKAGAGVKLDAVKPGDSVSFVAEDVGGTLTVTRIESAH